MTGLHFESNQKSTTVLLRSRIGGGKEIHTWVQILPLVSLGTNPMQQEKLCFFFKRRGLGAPTCMAARSKELAYEVSGTACNLWEPSLKTSLPSSEESPGWGQGAAISGYAFLPGMLSYLQGIAIRVRGLMPRLLPVQPEWW